MDFTGIVFFNLLVVVRPSFPIMTITSSMMMMMSCLVGPVGAEVANQSNSGLQHTRGMRMSFRLRCWMNLLVMLKNDMASVPQLVRQGIKKRKLSW